MLNVVMLCVAAPLKRLIWNVFNKCKKKVVAQNKTNLLLKKFWAEHEHYNYLQITQINDYFQKLLNVQASLGLALGWQM